MITEVLSKMISKLVEKFMTPEDLVLMTLLFALGILTTRLLPKFWSKPAISESGEKLCPLTGERLRCENIPQILEELKHVQEQNQEASVRITKVMNILSKEYDGQWDRYLYDKDLSPKEGSRVTR